MIRIWCTNCDCNMKDKGIAMDYPIDGVFFVCPKCNYRIVVFIKRSE